jgi:hypothetical protein
MNVLISFAVVVMSLIIAWAGFLFVVSAANPESRSKARSMLINAFIGLFIVLSAWLIVDFIMKHLYGDGSKAFGPWNKILVLDGSQCIDVNKNLGQIQGLPGLVGIGVNGVAIGSGGGSGGATGSGTPSIIVGGAGTTKLNISAAVSYALSRARSSSGSQCALYVRLALAAGGLTQFNANHPANAYQYGPYLLNAGFKEVYTGHYGPWVQWGISGMRAGDIVVFQPVTGHPSGHIAIYTGSAWVSDFKQSAMSSNPGDYQNGKFAVYRP